LPLTLQRFARRFGIAGPKGGGKNIAKALSVFPSYGNKAPRMEPAMVWSPQGGSHNLA
jgi:hypothetical protein